MNPVKGRATTANKCMLQLAILFLLILNLQAKAITEYSYNKSYDPFRNPFVDYQQAKRDAAAAGKLLLIDVGGDWCIWCKRLDRFLENHSDLSASVDQVFVVLKVNVSEEQSNLDFLKQFPAIKGYPHLIVVDSSGKYVGEQDTGKLEQGESYSTAKFKAFVAHWRAYAKR